MVSAERLAAGNGSYWNSFLPRLEHVVRISNLGPRRVAPPLHTSFPPHRQALVSETGFRLWAQQVQFGLPGVDLAVAERQARGRLTGLERSEGIVDPLVASEADSAQDLGDRLVDYFLVKRDLQHIEIESRLPGCGFVSGGQPDALAWDGGRKSNCLLEVKSVNRAFRSGDFRQLISYLVLMVAAGRGHCDEVVLLNPLRGTALELSVDELVRDASGEAADDVLQALASDWASSGSSQ